MPNQPDRPTDEQFTLFHLQPQHAGQTLSSVLKRLVEKVSWGQVESWVRSRRVQINGNLCLDPARRVTERDVIKLWQTPLPKPVDATRLLLPYLDEHLVIVEKPAGITSVWHREEHKMSDRRKQLQPTLEEMLPVAIAKAIGPPRAQGVPYRYKGGSGNKSKKAKWPVYPVHRLDRDTSGLMVFARTRLAEQKLVRMFRDHRIERQYWAVAQGAVESQTIRSILVRDRGDGLRGSLSDSNASDQVAPDNDGTDAASSSDGDEKKGQLAITHIDFVEAIGPYSLIRCRLETGRTHQIRIHLSEMGHPLCGEKTYIRKLDGQTFDDQSQAPRQVLHAERIVLKHPFTGEKLEYFMPLPPDLKHWLKRLRTEMKSRAHTEETPHE